MTMLNTYETLFSKINNNIKKDTTICVIISLFNYADLVSETFESIYNQTYEDIELMVVDDSSNDQSIAVTERWMANNHERFVRCSLIRHPFNRGLAVTRNTGWRATRSDYIFIMDADNHLYPRALARLREALEGRPYGAAYAQLELFGAVQGVGDADIWRKAWLAKGPYIDAMALIKRDVLERVNGYDHIEGGWEDYDFWCKLIEGGISAIFVPELLFRYRVHSKSMLRTETKRLADSITIEMHRRHPWISL